MRIALLVPLAGCRLVLGFDDVTPLSPEVPDAGPCQELTATCVGDTLRSCTVLGSAPVDTVCAWGCVEDQGRCARLVPSGGALTNADVLPDDLLGDLATGATTIDTESGQIGTVRAAGTGIIDGIDFSVRGGVGVFRVRSMIVTDVTVTGGNALSVVSLEDLTIAGVMDLRGPCVFGGAAGPGGGFGGVGTDGNGPGAGELGGGNTMECGGGGGAGHGVDGSRGGATNTSFRGVGGIAFGAPEIAVLADAGGSGGASGGPSADGGTGGAGGGAVQLVSNTRVRILGGAGINAGGCGGNRGQNSQGCGGGGGAGGAILIEAPIVELDGGLAVNGGAGGGALNTAQAGQNAQLSLAKASGGLAFNLGNGGDGGANVDPSGDAGDSVARGGGGGGGVGRIRVHTRDGVAQIGGTGFTSPPFSALTTATLAIANVQ